VSAVLVLTAGAAALLIGAVVEGLARRQLAARLRALSGAPSADTARMRPTVAWWPRRWRRSAGTDWASVLEGVARTVRTGGSLSVALAGVRDTASAPLRQAIRLHDVGAPLAEALATAVTATGASPVSGERADDERFALAALQVAAVLGGNVAATLDRAAGTLRERRAIRADRTVHSAQAHMSARVLSALPVAFGLWCLATDRRVARFTLGSPAGWACIAAGVVLNVAGWWWMRRIVGRAGAGS
jgi:tight adherence protein B